MRQNMSRPCGACCSNDHPDDYVIGTGETHAVREFVEAAFAYVGLDWQKYVAIDPRYFRPTEVDVLQADATRARVKLAWEPQVTFEELIAIMVDADMEALDLQPIGHGQQILTAKFAGWHQWRAAVTSCITARSGTLSKGQAQWGFGQANGSWSRAGRVFLGSWVVESLRQRGCQHIFVPRSKEYDLRRAEG